MYTVQFEWREDQEHGHWGWAPKKFPSFNVVQGMGVAHDSLEHFADDDGALHGELQAFGAMIHTRHMGGWHYIPGTTMHEPHMNMAHDFVQFMHTVLNGEDLKKAPKTASCRGDYAEEVEQMIDKTLKEAYRIILLEFDDDDMKRIRKFWGQFMEDARGWMRIGYRRAVRRFGYNSEELAYLFQHISKEADKKIGEEGDLLIVRVYQKEANAHVFIKPIYELDNY